MAQYHNKKETKKVGSHIQALRKKANWAIEDIAHMTGFSRSLIISVEAGNNTDTSHLIEIAKAIGIHPKELFDVDFVIIPRFKLSPKRQQKEFLTQKIKSLMADSKFFDTQRFVSDVIEKLKEVYGIKPSSTIVSVTLKRLVESNKLGSKKIGRRNTYIKRKK